MPNFAAHAAAAAILLVAPAAAQAPRGVSPGAPDTFATALACPSFFWTLAAPARGYDLADYRADDLAAQVAAAPVLGATLPAGASAWSPPQDRCLPRGGRYAWTVRAAGDEGWGPWAEPLLFAVPELSAATDIRQALDLLAAALGQDREQVATILGADLARGGEDVGARLTPGAAGAPAGTSPAQGAPLGAVTALRGEVPDPAGVTFGVVGLSNSPDGSGVVAENFAGGTDLLLGGTIAAELTESGLSRDSASNVSFNVSNPGAGTMTLQVDGANALTTATGVQKAGDTMTGTLTLDPTAGIALQTGSGDAVNLQGDVLKSGTLFLHDPGTSVALGREALLAGSGLSNTALGQGALRDNTSGFESTAVGQAALRSNTTGLRNTALGQSALSSNTTGSYNTAVGEGALSFNLVGQRNTALGQAALASNTGSHNTAVGAAALAANTTGTDNTAVGRQALGYNTTGQVNTAVGRWALVANTTGNASTAVGETALAFNTTGLDNTAVGRAALVNNTTGDDNIAIGEGAGQQLTVGNNNIMIGNPGVAAEGNHIRIGVQGTQTTTFIAGIHGNSTSGGIAVFADANGEIGTSASSRRFKRAIADLDGASARILDLRPVSFRYKEEPGKPGDPPLEYGLIAEEVVEVLPELIAYDAAGDPYSVRYHLLIPLLLNEVQRLEGRVRELERGGGR